MEATSETPGHTLTRLTTPAVPSTGTSLMLKRPPTCNEIARVEIPAMTQTQAYLHSKPQNNKNSPAVPKVGYLMEDRISTYFIRV